MALSERINLDDDLGNNMLYLAINAMMKSLAKTARGPTCPVCFRAIDVGDRYCRHCGQKIRWEDKAGG